MENHTSMTGLESCFEEELARADRKYVNPNLVKMDDRVEQKPARETKADRLVEEAMQLGS